MTSDPSMHAQRVAVYAGLWAALLVGGLTLLLLGAVLLNVVGIILASIVILFLTVKLEDKRRRELGRPTIHEDRAARKRAAVERRAQAAETILKWCPNCQQAVRPVRRATAGKLIATGALGFALTRPTMCPICRAENLQQSPPAAAQSA